MSTCSPPPDHRAPSWGPFAHQIFRRLLEASALDTEPAGPDGAPKMSEGRNMTTPSRPIDLFARTAGRFTRPSDEIAAMRADGLDPFATDADGQSRPPHALPPIPRLVLALRLAATFGTARAFEESCLSRGAVTVVEGLGLDDGRALSALFDLAVIPPEFAPRHGRDLVRVIAPAAPAHGAPLSVKELGDFAEELRRAFGQSAPIIVLRPDGVTLPAALHAVLPTPRRLAPLSGEMLLALLRWTHSATGHIDTAEVRPRLPDDADLARLDPLPLMAALRAPTARDVLERLAAFADAPTAAASDPGPRLEAMRGAAPALEAARAICADLGAWHRGEIGWSEMPHSLLLHGAPGTGKSWLARALGASAGLRFVQGSFAEWQAAGHLGQMLAAMRASFAEARTSAPAIFFIDEIDAAGSRFDDESQNRSYRTQVINGFLQEIDRLMQAGGVVLVGACNSPERLDPAILRPGRFDRHVELTLPDAEAILGQIAPAFPADPPEALRQLARALIGQTAAGIDALLRDARSGARARGVALRPEALCAILTAGRTDRAQLERRIALHECGHALVAAALGLGGIERIVLTSTGGFLKRRNTPEAHLRAGLEDELALHMAGRAAEQLMLGEVSGGAGGSDDSDLALATRLALLIEHQLGLGASGPLWRGPITPATLPPNDAARIRARLERAQTRARTILQGQTEALTAMAEALLEARELTGEALENWVGEAARHAPDCEVSQ